MITRNQYYYSLYAMDGKPAGHSSVEIESVRECPLVIRSVTKFRQQTSITAYFCEGRIVRSYITRAPLGKGRRLALAKEELWMIRRKRSWKILRRKLGVVWQQATVETDDLIPFQPGLMFPLFIIGEHLATHSSYRSSYYSIHGNWLGSCRGKRVEEGTQSLPEHFRSDMSRGCNGNYLGKLELVPLCPHVTGIQGVVWAEWSKGVPTQAQFPDCYLRRTERLDRFARFAKVQWRTPPKVTLKGLMPRSSGQERKVRFHSIDGTKLSGIFTCPKGSRNYPVVILVHGSGPENRDSGMGWQGRDFMHAPAQPFLELSRKLVARGIAVLRYDKRGIGESEGDWSLVTRNDLVMDLQAAIERVSAIFNRVPVILIGFSEGANLSISAAQKCPAVKGIVLAAGAAQSIDRVMLERLDLRVRGRGMVRIREKEKAHLRRVFRMFRSSSFSHYWDARSPKSFRGMSLGWWRQHSFVAPQEEAKELSVPVLLLHGKDDSEVLVNECKLMAKALRETGVPYKIRIFNKLNHLFTPACKAILTFEQDIPYSVAQEVIDEISGWIRHHFQEKGKRQHAK